jgi:serine/threonine protein kinase
MAELDSKLEAVEERTAQEASSFRGPGVLWDGRVQIRGEVGRGAMGQVLLGFDTKLRREMALKVTHLPRGEIPRELLARFVEEAQVTAQLEHPNIVPVHDLGLDPDGRAYFSMKLIRGRSLEEILTARLNGDTATLAEFGLRRLLDIFLQVCLAMEYAHARGVIHRDLKPANVMVGDFGEVAVMDWGVAKLREIAAGVSTKAEALNSDPDFAESGPVSTPGPVTSVRAETKAWQTHDGAVLGTPHYMAPEQANGLAVDERSDLYSLGVMLYEILCGQVPFDHEDAAIVVKRVIFENPKPPSTHDPHVPAALEALVMRLLAKEPDDRALPLHEVRRHVQNYIDGIAHDYRRESLWSSVAWSAGALVLFAFLVWYLTGQSIRTVLAIGPPAVLNAVGWFLLVLAAGYPLWAASTAFRITRRELDPFREPTPEELFVSGFLAHRTFSAALAPLFQLVFIVELVILAVIQGSRGGGRSTQIVTQLTQQMRAEWSEALIVVLVFQFAYLVLLASEVRFARRIDRCELLVRRAPWESFWPVFLIVVLLASVITTDVLALVLGAKPAGGVRWRELLQVPDSPFEIIKTLVFQGTFLLGLVATTMLAAFPVTELLAASRAVFHAADEASVASRAKYFLRSVAAIRVARGVWLYGGAMIGTLTAMRILSEDSAHPLLEKVVYILGPSSIGFIGYSALRGGMRGFLGQAPAVEQLVREQAEAAVQAQRDANLAVLGKVPWRLPLAQMSVPLACMAAYLLWTGSGLQRETLGQLVPVTTKDWLVVLPYVLLVPLLLARDPVQRWLLARARARSTPTP